MNIALSPTSNDKSIVKYEDHRNGKHNQYNSAKGLLCHNNYSSRTIFIEVATKVIGSEQHKETFNSQCTSATNISRLPPYKA